MGCAEFLAPTGRVLVITGGYGDGAVVTWDLATGARLAELQIAESGVVVSLATAVLAEGRIVGITAVLRENVVRVWDVTTGTLVGPPLVAPFAVQALAVYQADIPLLLIGGDGAAAIELRHVLLYLVDR